MENVLQIAAVGESFFLNLWSAIVSSMSISLLIKVVIGYAFIIWGAFVIWVIKDISNRTGSIFLQAISIFIILFFTPIFGLPIYLLIRPRHTLFEQLYEENELDEECEDIETHMCHSCGGAVRPEFHFCPHCETELLRACGSCGKEIETKWKICPFCGNKHTEKATAKSSAIPTA